MGQKGLIFLEGDGAKYFNQLNFQVFVRKSSIVWLSPGAALGGGVSSTLPSVKLDLDILACWNLYNYRAESLYYVLQTMQIQNQAR